ncbi:MAG: preprotein translocase subunit SecG [Coriobacteriia bacterium]|nr:preprotein translocase subunit SecG [Coriobacteriia bacterium]
MTPLVILFIILLLVSGVGMIVFIMLHSGKGTGVSDAISSAFYGTQQSISLVEKNLDKFTIICGVVFFISLIVLMLIYPQGTINPAA